MRKRAKLKNDLDCYPSMPPEDKIRLAVDILYDVNDPWDHDVSTAYPADMPSFDEFLAEIGGKLRGIRWSDGGGSCGS